MTAQANPAVRPEGLQSAPGVAPDLIPFSQASKRITEEGPSWVGLELKAENQVLERKPLLANGFLAALWVVIKTTKAGTAESGAKALEGYPWIVIKQFNFEDQGGKQIDTAMGGFEWWLACRFGGYNGLPDLSELDSYKAEITEFDFTLLIPQAISAVGWGSLTNQTEATHYFVQPEISQLGQVYKAEADHEVTKSPEFSIKVWVQYWFLPQAFSAPEPPEFPNGHPQEQRVPFEGTKQAWTRQAGVKLQAGENPTLITRVGQLIRTIILVTRNADGAFTEKVLPNPWRLEYERNTFRALERQRTKDQAKEMAQGPQSAIPTGVYPLILSEGHTWVAGDVNPDTYLATDASTRLEIKGNSEEAGTMDIIVNDVSVSAVSSQARREFPGQIQGAGPVA
jgi:hypothetical protein